MAKFEIEGARALKGKVKVAGNKNAVLPCMAAAILTEQECVFENVPEISDVGVMAAIMEKLGAEVEGIGTSRLMISAKNLTLAKLDPNLVSQLRASILLAGPLLAKLGKVSFHHPGGDVIGRRSIETHVAALSAFGVKFTRRGDEYFGEARKIHAAEVFLEEASVTATENSLLLAASLPGKTVIKNSASEPHVVNLCEMLIKMGAEVSGVGSNLLTIAGSKSLKGVAHRISSDQIEVGTFAIAAAVTEGEIEIEEIRKDDLDPILLVLSKMGVKFKIKKNSLTVFQSKLKATSKVTTGIWPAFPTDLMSALIVLATQAEGVTLLHDWMYESRMFFVDKLLSMGANVTIADPHRVLVYGKTQLHGQVLDTPDIRAGMALILAALAAEGKSTIDKIELVERGYERIEERLSKLGARIIRRD